MGRLQFNSNIDPQFNNISLLLPFDNNFNDFSKNNFSVTVNGDAQISTAQKKFGRAAGYFTAGMGANPIGIKSWLTTPSPLLNGISAYTLEAWVYLNSPDYYRTVYSTRVINTGSSFGFTDSNEIFAYSDETGGLFSGEIVPHNQWAHVAWTYDGINFRMFIDGIKVYDEVQQLSHGAASYIGRASIFPEPNYGEFFVGYMDDFRITNGISLYISNFIPPSKLPLNINNKISIKKQNLGGGKLSAKLIQPASPFSPTSIAGLKLWLKADAGVTEAGGVVTSWADQSGEGNNATEATLNPALITNAINGLPAVNFNGSRMSGPNIISSTPCTIFAVVSFETVEEIGIFFQQYDIYDNVAFYRGFNGGTTRAFRLYNGENLESTIETNDNEFMILGTTVNQANSKLFYNGDDIETVSTGPVNTDAGNLSPQGFYYLGYWKGAEESRTVKIAEIIAYDSALSTQDREAVEAYLNDKYAIY